MSEKGTVVWKPLRGHGKGGQYICSECRRMFDSERGCKIHMEKSCGGWDSFDIRPDAESEDRIRSYYVDGEIALPDTVHSTGDMIDIDDVSHVYIEIGFDGEFNNSDLAHWRGIETVFIGGMEVVDGCAQVPEALIESTLTDCDVVFVRIHGVSD